jgi:hypothetical protein
MGGEEFRDDVLTFAGADTFVKGTILARDNVSGKLVLFVKGGATNENGIPKAVLTYGVERAGAGDEAVRVLVKGRVRKDRLVIDADGDDSNIDETVCDQLRDYGITPVDTQQLAQLDNQ